MKLDKRDMIQVFIVPADNGYTVTVIDQTRNEQFREVAFTHEGVADTIRNYLRYRELYEEVCNECNPENREWPTVNDRIPSADDEDIQW